MNGWENVPIDKLQKLAEILTESQDPVDMQGLSEVVAEISRREQAGGTALGGVSQESIDRLTPYNLGPESDTTMPSVPITAAESQTIAQRERLATQQARRAAEEEAAYKAKHPYRHAAGQAADWGKSITTPESVGALFQAGASLPILAYEASQMAPQVGGPVKLLSAGSKVASKPLARTAKYLGYAGAEGTAYATGHELGRMLPWNKDRYPDEGLGSFSKDPWNIMTSGTGYLGNLETGAKFGLGGFMASPLIGEVAKGARRGVLGLQKSPIGYDPSSPVLFGRGVNPLSRDSQNIVNDLSEQYAALGLTQPMGSKWWKGGRYEGPPSVHAATRSGGTLAGAYAGAMARMPIIGTPMRKGIAETARRAKETILNRIALVSNDDWSVFDLGNKMFEAVQVFGKGQLLAIDRNYRTLWDTAARYAGGRDVVDMAPFRDAISDVLGAKVLVPTTGLPTTVAGVRVRAKGFLPEWKQGSDVSKWLRDEVMQIGNAHGRLTMPQWKQAHEQIRKAVKAANPDTDDYRILMNVNERFKDFSNSVFANANRWKGETPKGLSDDAAGTLVSLRTAAGDSHAAFARLVNTTAAKEFKQAEGSLFTRAHLIPRSGNRFSTGGSIETDALFDAAFKISSPQYIANIRRLIDNPKVYNAAVKRRLEDAVAEAFSNPMVTASPGAMVTGRFNHDVFKRALGIGHGDELLDTLLKGTGVDPKAIRAFGELLSDLPMNNDIATMLARRVALQGMKGVTSFSPLSMLLGAATGGVTGGALAGIGAASMMALILGARRFSTVLSRPKMMDQFVTAGKTEKQYLAGKTTKALYTSRNLALMKGVYDIMSDPYREEDYRDSSVYRLDEADRRTVLQDLRTAIKTAERTAIQATSLIPDSLTIFNRSPEGGIGVDLDGKSPVSLEQTLREYLRGRT